LSRPGSRASRCYASGRRVHPAQAEIGHSSLVGEAFAHLYLSTYRVNLSQYEGQYEFWHNPMVMTVKICANNILYSGTDGFDDDGIRARLAATADTMKAFAMLALSRAAQNLGTRRQARTWRSTPTRCRWLRIGGRPTGCSTAVVFRSARFATLRPPGGRTCSWRRWRSRSEALTAARVSYATSGRVSALTNSSSWSVRQHSNAVQCFSYAAITLSP